jgi:hypothetical protein
MSLINEALKKAQRTRQVEPAANTPAVDPHLGERVRRRGEGPDTKTVVLIALASVSACALVVVAAVLLLDRRSDDAAVAAAPAAVTVSPASVAAPELAAAPVVSVQQPSAVAAPIATPIISTSAAPASDPAAPVVTLAPAPIQHAPEATTAVATPLPSSPAPTPSAEAPVVAQRVVPSVPTSNPEAVDFIDRIRVAGVRASATDPKVLMNDRVYRLDDVVNRALGLRLTEISASTLTFVDDSGYQYKKAF